MRSLEVLEADYSSHPSHRALMDIIFTVAAQLPIIPKLLQHDKAVAAAYTVLDLEPWIEYAVAPHPALLEFAALVRSFFETIIAVFEIMQMRHADMIVSDDDMPPRRAGSPPYGDVNYLMRVSHSVSRMNLWPEVAEALGSTFRPRTR